MRFDVAALAGRLEMAERLIARNRVDLEVQLLRIAELQAQVDLLKAAGPASPATALGVPVVVPKPTIES